MGRTLIGISSSFTVAPDIDQDSRALKSGTSALMQIPRWVPPLFFGVALVLMPWTAWLFYSLPQHKVASHWAIAWGGFDVALGLSLAATGYLVLRRSPFSEMSATVAATMLACDAWFDVLTSRGRWEMAQSVTEAVLIELPLTILCLWIAGNVERVLAVAEPHLELDARRDASAG